MTWKMNVWLVVRAQKMELFARAPYPNQIE